MDKKVSVIIPFYNRVDWLCEAVQSVLDQTYKNFEIIVVNDGSTEDILPFLDKFGDKIIYRFKENGGPASARNLAMSLATGEYIAFLDSDDIWLPLKTEKQIAFMEKIDAMWSHTGYYNWYPEKNLEIKKNNSKDYGDVYLQSFLSLRAPTPAIIVKKICFDNNASFYFNEDMRIAEDSSFWSKISFLYPLALLREPLVKIRQRGTNADLSSLIRFEIKTIIYQKIKEGEYKDLPLLIKSIYLYYVLIQKVFIKLKITNKTLSELLCKVFWIPPFIFERLFVLVLQINKDKKYRN